MSGKEDAVKVVGQVAENHKFTLMQDAWHLNDANFDFAWSKEMVQELASKDVKHYVTEYPTYFQPVIDAYNKGEFTKEQAVAQFSNFWTQQSKGDQKRTAENFVDLLDAAKENGIKVHAIDKHGDFTSLMSADSIKAPNIKTVGDMKMMLESERNIRGEGFCDGMLGKASRALDKMNLADDTSLKDPKLVNLLNTGTAKERENDDKMLAKNVKQAIGNEKGAGTLGFMHGKREADFDEFFGNNNVGKVLLTPSKSTLQNTMRPGGVETKEIPATVVFTDASKWPGHQVEIWQHKAKEIGAELKISEYKESDYSQLKLPSAAEIARAPKAIPVNEAEVRSR